MKYDFFGNEDMSYNVSSYLLRVEFQQRGASHVQSLLWVENEKDEEAPAFWTDKNEKIRYWH